MESIKRLDVYLNSAFRLGNSQTILILGRRDLRYLKMIKHQVKSLKPITVVLSGIISNDDTEALLNVAYQLYLHKSVNLDVNDKNFQEILAAIHHVLEPQDNLLIIIKDIDQFAHRFIKQNLLYTLFEFIHEERVKTCLIGITSRLDFSELLEKRIRSRFSYESILTMNYEPQLTKDQMLGRTAESTFTQMKIVQQLKEFELAVLLTYIRLIHNENKATPNAAFYSYLKMIVHEKAVVMYSREKTTFIVVSKELVRLGLLQHMKKPKLFNYAPVLANFDTDKVIQLLRMKSLRVCEGFRNWVLKGF